MATQDSFSERLKTIAEGVLTLEVNTVICPHIEAEKMPQPEHALIDVANEYGAWLRDHHHQTDIFVEGEPSTASAAVFLKLRTSAAALQLVRGEESNLLERIRKNSDQLLGVFLRLDAGRDPVKLTRGRDLLPQAVELKPEEIVLLRKAWELMLDEIALQTTIQIDGDVILRMLRRSPEGVDMAHVMAAHEHAVSTSTRFWADLVSLVGGALRGLGQLLAGNKPG